MKQLFFFSFFLLLCSNMTEAQTYAAIPDSSHVLVVYKVPENDQDTLGKVSELVKTYYQQTRGIPAGNVVPLSGLVSADVNIDGSTHNVIIAQNGDIIQDSINAIFMNTPTRHAWKYYLDRVATPIKQHIINNNLLNIIRYIVLCKGVPFKIQAAGDWSGSPGNLTVDGVLALLNTDNYETKILNDIYPQKSISNKYYQVDKNFTLDYRFLPDFFTSGEYKLSYLVSHLDGIDLQTVKNIIDRSKYADTSGTGTWVIDDDPSFLANHYLQPTIDILQFLDFDVEYNFDDTWLTQNNINSPVIGYTSWGTHAEDRNCSFTDSNYIVNKLNFLYLNGAVFNTIESFNGNSLGTLNWRHVVSDSPSCTHTQGLATQFPLVGGTSFSAHAWEPTLDGVIENSTFFPSYAVGYNLVEAAYMGMKYLSWQNVIVGDPLTRIYNYQIDTLISNIVLSATTIKHKIVVPAGITLTLAGTVSFERNAQLIVQGGLVIQDNSIIDFGNLSYLKTPNIVIGSGVSLTFKSKARFEINNSISVGTNSFLTIKENATGTVPSMEIMGGTYFSLMDNGTLNVAGSVVVHSGSTLSLGSSCRINSNTGLFMPGSFCNLSGNAVLNFKNLTVNPGCSLTVANNSKLETTDKFISIANENSKIYYLSAGSGAINASGADSLIFTYSEFNGARLSIKNNQSVNNPAKPVEVSNCVFINGNAGLELWSTTAPSKRIDISNCTFTNLNTSAILLGNNCYAEIEDVTITGTVNSEQQNAIIVESVYDVIINELTITDYGYGVTTARREGLTEILSVSLFTLENSVISCEYPVLLNSQEASLGSITLFNLILSNGSGAGGTAITINGADRGQLRIGNNSCSGFEYGIQITNSNNFSLTKNTVTNCFNGIQLNNVNNYFLIKNNLTGTSSSVGIGVDNFSGNGMLRNNTITNYQTGILSNNSTSDIGMYGNNITQNKLGVWMYDGKIDMSKNSLTIAANNFYSNLYGYNIIKENGTENCATEREEIKIENGQLLLVDGCNEITDDRHDGLSCGHEILIDGKTGEYQINGIGNYWGTRSYHGHDPIGRFGEEIQIEYNPFLSEPCIPLEGQATQLFLTGSNTVIDTIIISPVNGTNLTGEELLAALADGAMLQAQYNDAKNYYHQLLNLNVEDQQSYIQLFQIEKMLEGTNDDFRILREYYESKLNSITESEVHEVVEQLINFCYVAEEDYETALDNYNELVANYPATYRAYCAELNILSTSLLIGNSGLQKAGKYKGVSLAEYRNKLNEIKAKYGFIKVNEKENLPTEYALSQNFPNPFNPVTTIRYEIPKSGRVSLKIYDILGRIVTTLINEEKEPGRYTVNFDASVLSSGVYFYELAASDYRAVKKLMVIK